MLALQNGLVRAAGAALFMLLASGCAGPPYWVHAEEFEPKEIIVQTLDVTGYAPTVRGWAVRDHKTGNCYIYVARNIDRACVLEHERKHCHGWDHPDYPVNLACAH